MRILLAACALAACGPAGRDTGVDATSQPDAGNLDADPDADATTTTDTSRVYAHSGDRLYRLNNLTLSAAPIGTMTGLEAGLLDLAVDKNDQLVGVTRERIYSISATTGAATLIRNLQPSAHNLSSLSFTEDPANPAGDDILVSANDAGVVFKLNPTTGEAIQIGNYGMFAGQQIKSSGDLFGVRGLGIYATVDIGTETQDYLAKIDPSQGWKATVIGPGTGFDKIFGLGYWGGKIYGFVDDGFAAATGKMIQIDATTGVAIELSSSDVRWFGAGVATDAPIL